jgi:hypothetical protein
MDFIVGPSDMNTSNWELFYCNYNIWLFSKWYTFKISLKVEKPTMIPTLLQLLVIIYHKPPKMQTSFLNVEIIKFNLEIIEGCFKKKI